MTKFKTLRGLAGYLVRKEGEMTAKKSRAKIGDTVQMLGVLSDLTFDQHAEVVNNGNKTEACSEVLGWVNIHFANDLLIFEGAKRWLKKNKQTKRR
jgi:hypothetical protein